MAIVKEGFIAEGTTCDGCSKIIKKQALKVKGVKEVTFDYETEIGYLTYDDKKTDLDAVLSKIEEKGYKCFILDEEPDHEHKNKNFHHTLGWGFGIVGISVIGYFLFNIIDGFNIPQISQNMGYGLLFIVGLLTGFHCIGMCGGFVLSYTAKDAQQGKKSYKSHLMYGFGKTVSYTIIGAAFGLLGLIIVFTPAMRGVIGMLAGLFLVIFGLNMLNVFPWLRKIRIKSPKFLDKFVAKESREHKSPLIIGLLNGLMIACGPLQAIYIMAAGTGSPFEGAKLLFVFAIGTLPVMIGFGFLASVISSKMTHKILKASGVIVIILGIIMINRGLSLTGSGLDANSLITSVSATSTPTLSGIKMEDGFQVIEMKVNRYGWEPDKFVLKKNVPVRWKIIGEEINGCNNAIQVPKYGLKFDIKKGEQVIEFTPTEEGVIPWSCWMGMIPGTFVVKDDADLSDAQAVQKELDAIPEQKGGSCGGSCGSASCGAAAGGTCGCGG